MKRLIYALIIATGLFFFHAPDAFAHKIAHRVVVVHDGYVVGKYRPAYPHWLRRHHDFQRWYLRSHYRHMRHPSWHRLYQLYRHDARIHRHLDKRIRHGHRHRHRH